MVPPGAQARAPYPREGLPGPYGPFTGAHHAKVLLKAITQKLYKGEWGGEPGGGARHPPWAGPHPWGGLGLLDPARGAQHSKVPRTRVWLFGAITQKLYKGEPAAPGSGAGHPQGPGHSPLGRLGLLVPFRPKVPHGF